MFKSASDEMRDTLIKLIPLGRPGRPHEAAAAALFLATHDSSFTTGAELCVDGGAARGARPAASRQVGRLATEPDGAQSVLLLGRIEAGRQTGRFLLGAGGRWEAS